ncbi:hypothetical protein AB6A23_17160 [Paenibacillus tarimensis]
MEQDTETAGNVKMIDRKISLKGVILIVYGIFIFFAGVLFVPCYEVWGPERNEGSLHYVFLFHIKDADHIINGFPVMYQIDYARVLYTIGIISLIHFVIWMLISLWEREDGMKGR